MKREQFIIERQSGTETDEMKDTIYRLMQRLNRRVKWIVLQIIASTDTTASGLESRYRGMVSRTQLYRSGLFYPETPSDELAEMVSIDLENWLDENQIDSSDISIQVRAAYDPDMQLQAEPEILEPEQLQREQETTEEDQPTREQPEIAQPTSASTDKRKPKAVLLDKLAESLINSQTTLETIYDAYDVEPNVMARAILEAKRRNIDIPDLTIDPRINGATFYPSKSEYARALLAFDIWNQKELPAKEYAQMTGLSAGSIRRIKTKELPPTLSMGKPQ